MADGVKVKVRDLDIRLAKLRKIVPAIDTEVDGALAEVTGELVSVAQSVAPKKTGAYASSINARRMDGTATFENRKYKGGRGLFGLGKRRLSVSSRTISATLSWGVFANWIWTFLEFGTVNRPATPHLFPAYRLLRKKIKSRIRRAMNKAVKDALRK